MTRRPTRNPRSGYALLFVYMMAAFAAIMLYMEIPRAEFEMQRDKEQLLIDRGEQYKRAVQLFVRKFNRYPPDIDSLEKTQNMRFLRKQYADPMTGKKEWRLIHVGPGGVFTDSKVYGQQPQSKDKAAEPQTFITELQPIGGNTAPNQNVNLANRRRPSDGSGGGSDPNNPGSSDPNNPGAISGPVMVLPDGRIVPATTTGIPAATGPQNGATTPPNGFPPGFTPPSGMGIQSGSTPPAPGAPPQPGGFGFQNTPNGAVAPPSSAANMINQILTTPRPGGLAGVGGTQTTAGLGGPVGQPAGQGMGGQTIGGGIAGVASKLEQEGIKTYNEKTSYDLWEFVYDISKDKTRGGGVAVPQQPAQPQQPGQQPQQPAQQSSPAGSAPASATGTGTTGTPN